MAEVRVWHLSEALTSFRRLNQIIKELTEEEVRKALSLESEGRRRKSIITTLEARLKHLHKEKFKWHVPNL